MTATQAPTPGPLTSDGAGPYSCIRCDNSTWNDDDICDQCAAEACSPENAVDWPDETADPIDERTGHPSSYTAPVEASGSELEQRVNIGFQTDEPTLRQMIEHYYRSHSMPDPMKWADRYVAALRPQPSGEPREVVERVEAFLGSVRGLIRQEGRTLDPADIRALLSARPLALGGQQGEGRIVPQHSLEIALNLIKTAFPDELYLIETLSTAPFATTPARAEAQDEGAAGERERIARIIDPDQWALQDFGASKNDGERLPGWEVFLNPSLNLADRILAAHPSPTPAADADRVRIAVEALEDIEQADPYHVSRIIASEALAALKSEGK